MSGGITRDLHLATHAMRGADVKALQKALNSHLKHHAKDGAPKPLAVDGGYGPATAHAFRWVAYYVLGFPQGTIDKGATKASQRLVRDTGGLDKTKRNRAAKRLKALHAASLEGGAGLAFPLGRRPSAVYGPGTGTHSWSAPPNNWESDNACDLMTPSGTPLYAVDDGVIGSQFGPLGPGSGRFAGIRLHLEVAHRSSGIEWYYAHLRDTAPGIRPGARVRKGQLLGHSGVANGVAHLHIACELGYGKRDGRDVRRLLGV